MQSSFKWHEGTIHITNTSVATRLRINHLQRLAGLQDTEDAFEKEAIATCTFYLAHVEKVEGDAGITIPNGNATAESVKAFIVAFMQQDESLMELWDNAIIAARTITNSPDLLPPEEIDPNA